MKILQSRIFTKAVKKFHVNQLSSLKTAIATIADNPLEGERKRGDLADVRVHKFHIHHQLFLLAYLYDEKASEVNLLSVSAHENFYRDLKKTRH